MDWEQFAQAMSGLGYLIANATLDGSLVCQMVWRCDHPGCTTTAQMLQPGHDIRHSPELAFIFDLAIDAKKQAQGECRH